jgi:hypothetical protein
VFGGTIYSPELFSNPNKNVESDDTTLCDNISNTLIASGNENDTCTSGSEEVDITDNEHGNIFAPKSAPPQMSIKFSPKCIHNMCFSEINTVS